jgi:non-specific serine/threonine protein kinase
MTAMTTLPSVIGAYAVERELGRGGMGIVYLARDATLDRRVAIKVLPDALAKDADRLARFEREARLLASLTHPNIAVIHALESTESDDRFLVLEYVEGRSLADRLREGPLALEDALRIGAQIAGALHAAHEKGVVHRDLKPSNVMLTGKNIAKVLDFGLAKRAESGPSDLSHTPTATIRATQPGSVIGTAGYMSPEQARGLEVDARTDVFSFGCVLYECLAGMPAFDGETASDALAQVLTGEPNWRKLPEETPTSVLELLLRSMSKEVKDRLSDLDRARELLESAARDRRTGSASRLAKLAAPPTNLPAAVTSFVGRARELTELTSLLDRSRVVTLTGSGGCGKTRLAQKLGEQQLASHPDGVWFVGLGGVTDVAIVNQTIMSALGLKDEHGKPTIQTLTDHLREKQSLLILDNCEHLVEACAEIADSLLQACPKLRVLATSRQRLGMAGEATYHVPSLGLPAKTDDASPERLLQSESVRLFVDRASAASSRFKANDQVAPIVAQICRQLDGIPLAIELAAARVKAMPVGQIARRLDDSFRLLRGGSSTALERHQTLQATIDWSYSLLVEEEQTLLRRLSVFSGGWTLEAAEAVCAGDPIDELDVLDLLSQLVEKSLVVYEERNEEARYRLLETMRQYALSKLIDSGEAAALRDKHLAHYLALVEEAEPHLRGSVEWLERVDAEQQNVLSAHKWCGSSKEKAEEGLRLIGLFWRVWDIKGQQTLGQSVIGEALDRPGAAGATTARARALFGAGGMAVRQGNYDEAKRRLEDCLSVSESIGGKREAANANNALAILAMDNDQMDTARERFEAALALFQEIGDQIGEATVLGNLGELWLIFGDATKARTLLEEAVRTARQSEALSATSLPDQLRIVAQLCIHAGELENARSALLECMRLTREFSSRLHGVFGLETSVELAVALAGKASGDEASEWHRRGAVLQGAAEGLRQSMGAPVPPSEREGQEKMRSALRAALGEGYEAARNSGRTKDFEQIADDVIGWLEG